MVKICIFGLGYVGLPLLFKASSKFNVIGYDIDKKRISDLRNKIDKNNEFKKKDFNNKKLFFTNNINNTKGSNFYIICTPTPIDKNNKPNLNPIKKSFSEIAKFLKKGDIIILESTVYPGVTELFTKKLEKKTGLINNKDFFVCYSPERINPGDRKKSLSNINKIIAFDTKNKKISKIVKIVYQNFCKKLIITSNIKETETAKVIENIQRDLNISLFNELLIISNKLDLNFSEIIRLANTKWNFMKFQAGLVGGHCLPVDPYYLSYVSQKHKFKPNVILAGRKINESMKYFVISQIIKKIQNIKNTNKKNNDLKILIVGLTYKYGVADMRNSQNYQIFQEIKKNYRNTFAYDPFSKESTYDIEKNYNNLSDFKLIVFLSKGPLFKEVYRKINLLKNDSILDPFYYYNN